MIHRGQTIGRLRLPRRASGRMRAAGHGLALPRARWSSDARRGADAVKSSSISGSRTGGVPPDMRLIRVKQGDARQAALDQRPADHPASARLRHRDQSRAGRGRRDDLHGARDGAVPGRGAQARCARSLPWRGSACPHRGPPALARRSRGSRHCWRSPRPLGASTPASAHGFGQRYELPLPLALYLFGAAAVVALSFVVFGLFVRRASAPRRACASGPARPVRSARSSRIPPSSWRFGSPRSRCSLSRSWPACSATRTPTATSPRPWCGSSGGSGLPCVAAFAGDVWALVNPWRTVFDGAQWLSRRLGGTVRWAWGWPIPKRWAHGRPACCCSPFPGPSSSIRTPPRRHTSPLWPLPIRRSPWPACSCSAATPGCGTARSSRWCSARWAASRRSGWSGDRLVLRPFGAGLIESRPVSASMVAFVLLLLAVRALRRADRHRRMGPARERRAGALSGRRQRSPSRPPASSHSGCVFLGAYLGDLRRHEPRRRRPAARRSRWRAASPSRWCRSPSAITSRTISCFCWSRGNTSFRCCPIRWARMGPVRHRRLPRRHRVGRCPLCLVRGARRDRRRPRVRRLSRARARHRGVRAGTRGAGARRCR